MDLALAAFPPSGKEVSFAKALARPKIRPGKASYTSFRPMTPLALSALVLRRCAVACLAFSVAFGTGRERFSRSKQGIVIRLREVEGLEDV